jgi:hypothetical protein
MTKWLSRGNTSCNTTESVPPSSRPRRGNGRRLLLQGRRRRRVYRCRRRRCRLFAVDKGPEREADVDEKVFWRRRRRLHYGRKVNREHWTIPEPLVQAERVCAGKRGVAEMLAATKLKGRHCGFFNNTPSLFVGQIFIRGDHYSLYQY